MMKKIGSLTLLFLTVSLSNTYSQNVGLRGNAEFSNERRINNAIGLGGYLNLNDLSEKFELLFSIDYNYQSKEFPDEDLKTTYNRFYFSISGLYKLTLAEKVNLKIGPGISYNMINSSNRGIILRWIETSSSQYIGTELLVNLHFNELLNGPINFDIFFTPSYLFDIQNNDTAKIESKYTHDFMLMSLQFGVSYKIK